MNPGHRHSWALFIEDPDGDMMLPRAWDVLLDKSCRRYFRCAICGKRTPTR